MFFSFEDKKYSYSASRTKSYGTTPHVHTHIEIVAINGNGSTKATADGNEVTVENGDIFISFPGQIHYYNDISRPIDGYLLIVSPDMCPEFDWIFKGYKPETPLFKGALENPRIKNSVNSIVELYRDGNEYSETEVKGYFLVLLSEIFKGMKLTELDRRTESPVKDVIKYCYDNYTGDISLGSIAEALHISPCYISHIFNGRLHISLNDYINSLRITKACEMLKSGDTPITEISYAVGYNSPRTFDRCFVKIKGKTPKEYRKTSRG